MKLIKIVAMVNFQRILRQIEREKNILILGFDSAGKTTLINRLLNMDSIVEPTFGYTVYQYGKYTIYDVGGQEIIRKYWNVYFEDITILFYVIDINDESRIKENEEMLYYLYNNIKYKNIKKVIIYNRRTDDSHMNVRKENGNYILEGSVLHMKEDVDRLLNLLS